MSNFSIGAEATEASQFPTGHKNVIKCQSKARQSKTKLAQRNVIKIYKHRKVGAAPDFWRSWKYFLLEKKMKQLKNDFFFILKFSFANIMLFLLATFTQSCLAKHRFCRCPSVMWSRTCCWEDGRLGFLRNSSLKHLDGKVRIVPLCYCATATATT